ncbi:MAG: SDR family oxidoreductase [Spirochaetia bacterium]|nr:SDR family oxidoreductase [Spirochaetia bacterium]
MNKFSANELSTSDNTNDEKNDSKPEKNNLKVKLSQDDIDHCLQTLQSLVENSEPLSELPDAKRIALLTAAGLISHPSKEELLKRKNHRKKIKRLKIVNKERLARAQTGIREARKAPVFVAPKLLRQMDHTDSKASVTDADDNNGKLHSPRNCYVCKAEYTQLHFFYDTMCTSCGDFNYKKRFQSASLEGRVAVITGSRLKIGYHATLMMLRAGARVIATTRFPVDSAIRFSKEEDYCQWKDRLQIFGLDLRHTPSVEIFAAWLEKNLDRLDILINNAAQTVRRPPGFYAHLMANETSSFSNLKPEAQKLLEFYKECKDKLNVFTNHSHVNDLSKESALPVEWHAYAPGIGIRSSAELSQIPYTYDNSMAVQEVFPEGKLDADLQQVDLRTTNSWRLRLGEIPTSEMFEIQLVNAIAPFVLCNRLVSIMRRDYTGEKHIVNVSAMEGKFYRYKKADRHPHTNMAKAALNMLTHTSASDFAKDGIFMNAVDTGWVTDEDPAQLSKLKEETHDFQPPLDIVDGAARVCDPFFNGILTGNHVYGKFLKDYHCIDW